MDDKIAAAKKKLLARQILEEALAEIARMGLMVVARDKDVEVALDIWTSAYQKKVEILFDEI